MQKFWFSFKIFRFKRFILIYLLWQVLPLTPPPNLKYLVTFYEYSTNPFCILSTGAYKACNVKSLIISIFSLSVSFTRWWNICVELKWENTAGHIITHEIIICWVIRWKISVHCTLFHYNIKLWSNASTWKSSVSFRTIKLIVCFMKIYQCHISTHKKTQKCSQFQDH